MALKTVKNVSDEKWAEMKGMAAKSRITMGRLLENMVDAYAKHREEAWNRILYGEKNLSDREAGEMRAEIYRIRREKWFK